MQHSNSNKFKEWVDFQYLLFVMAFAQTFVEVVRNFIKLFKPTNSKVILFHTTTPFGFYINIHARLP